MSGFNFEKNLVHQDSAVANTLAVFDGLEQQAKPTSNQQQINPIYNRIQKQDIKETNKLTGALEISKTLYDQRILPISNYVNNIRQLQTDHQIDIATANSKSNVIDIMMETGTGKTYTYTKTMFELNRQYGIIKFIVIVPTLSIKAGTIDFLKSESSRAHFKEQYGKTIKLHIVESQKSNKNKKSFLPPAVMSFVNASEYEKDYLQVMIINAGMINSDTMQKSFDRGLFDKYTIPFEAISAVCPFVIIDEPHKFGQDKKTWENIQKLMPQFVLRYGATFPEKEIERKNEFGKKVKVKLKDYHNLVYQLTAVDAFNSNLVKGVIGHITEFESGKNALVKFIDSDGTQATVELSENHQKKTIKLAKSDSLHQLHAEMGGLTVENINKTTLVLSNGLELKKGDKINPYSYSETLQTVMIQKAVRHHFELEKQLLTREVKIKPLTLFFIDNIEEYRSQAGSIRKTLEACVKAELETLLKAENTAFYQQYLETALQDISLTHGGYFSKDNSEKDEAIEQEITEILHDKQTMLALDNPRRFIFSKWTLREGWDNPNVFQICKLRSSGSDISKLQEVGRGLRLPVNEYGNRVKEESFYLNYFVDFTESDFIDQLVSEINQKSGAISIDATPEKLSEDMIQHICRLYEMTEESLLVQLDENNIITRTNGFKTGGFEFIKEHYPRIFEGVNINKIRKFGEEKKKVSVRTGKYQDLKALWEKLNEKVILEYQFKDEAEVKQLLVRFLSLHRDNLTPDNPINERVLVLGIEEGKAVVKETPDSVYQRSTHRLSTMTYREFIEELAKRLAINMKTLHHAMLESGIDINAYLNQSTIRVLKQSFDYFLMANAFNHYQIEYQRVSNRIHPTKFTDESGNPLAEIPSVDIGSLFSQEGVAPTYFLDALYFDSELEKTNIKTNIEEVIVFTKIPKNSIKIPVAGGKTYSPDFAYVLKQKDGHQHLHFVVETKNVHHTDGLRDEEKFKIKHAEKFFGDQVNIVFKTQLSANKMIDLITDVLQSECVTVTRCGKGVLL